MLLNRVSTTDGYSENFGPAHMVGNKLCARVVLVDWNLASPVDGAPKIKGMITSYEGFQGFMSDLLTGDQTDD